ncbi:type IV pilin N-terminal domain-containing protein [Haloterrigena sp. SYSU A121-1]|uniref:Type IV pilin N-terminal domain-containing protein n=1 Tax=Haloterrigena gelatinilytica TaxID=2741724 RepID=A0A8J8KIQ7_9EURY|nr:type IV pilin N-terminal domain-containing protein [Haloterrigena gelatinilytica]NUB92534.1 type IV pilin N-terminal domain-containing protein [Haloterrigena gelatinilytica]
MDLSKYRNKLVGSEEERAVSPVIGVILMVAITVILAAVIAAFVLDMGDSMGSGSVNAATDSNVNGSNVTVTVNDMGNADGIAIVDGSGTPANTTVLSSTGQSHTYNLNNNTEYTIQAFQGDTNITAGEPLDDQVDSTTIISNVETDS